MTPSNAAASGSCTAPATTSGNDGPISLPRLGTIPSWSLVTTEDRGIPVAAQRFMSARATARTTTIDASHAVSVSRPEAVTRIAEQAARTVR